MTSQPYYLSGNTLHYVVRLFDHETRRQEVPSSMLITELLDQDGTLIFHHIHSMSQGSSPGSYDLPDTLGTGCYWLRAYTRYQVDFTENLIHYLPVFIIHPDDMSDPETLNEKLDVSQNLTNRQGGPDQDEIRSQDNPSFQEKIRVEILEGEKTASIRETVSLTIRMTDQNGDPVTSRFIFLVRDQHQFSADLIQPRSLPDYSSLQGKLNTYRIGGEDNPGKTLPSITGVLPEKMAQPKYQPQKELKLKGRYVEPKTLEKLSFRAISLTQTGQNPGFKLLFTDREGKFEFNQLNFNNQENQLVLNAGINEGIIIENELVRPPFSPPPVDGNLMQAAVFQQYLKMREIDLQYKKFYSRLESFDVDSSLEKNISRYRIYEKADRSYDLDNYIELIDMREVIIELLPNVKIFKEDDQTRIKIFYHGNVDILPDPLFLVNGKVVKDNDFILNMDNRNIESIEVLFKESSLEPFGPIGMGGVVAIYTKEPIEIPFGIPLDFMGYHAPDERVVQFNPRENGSDHYPDFNPLLYWDPECVTDEKGIGKVSFYTNDLASDYEVIIEGLTREGIPFYHQGRLSVKKPLHP